MRALLLPLLWMLCSCDSPMNHRLHENQNLQEKLQTKNFSQMDYQVEIQWIRGPFSNIQTTSSLLVLLKDPQGKLVNLPPPYTLAFYASMPSMGHPLDSAGDFLLVSDGLYLNTQIRYNMEGDWKNELWILDENLNLVDKVEWNEFL